MHIVINIVTKVGQERKRRGSADFFYFAHPNLEFAHPGFNVLGGKKYIVAHPNHYRLCRTRFFPIILL